MFHTLCVDLSLSFIDTDREEESEHDLVALSGLLSHGLTELCEFDRSAWLALDESFTPESVHDSGDCDVRDPHATSECADSCAALGLDELRDCFDIIFRGFIAVRCSCRRKTRGLGYVGAGSGQWNSLKNRPRGS